MDGLTLTTTTTTITTNSSVFRFDLPSFLHPKRCTNLSFPRKAKKLVVFASKDDPNIDRWDQMELKFGQLLGEDPKLTLAKIMGRKSNPEMSYLEIEKLFNKKKGKAVNNAIEEVPFDGSVEGQSSDPLNGLYVVRPVPNKGVKFETNEKPKISDVKRPSQPVAKADDNTILEGQSPDPLNGLNLIRPVPKKGVKFEATDKPKKRPSQPVKKAVDNTRDRIHDVILRKPTMFSEDDDEMEKLSRLRIKPNLALKMGKEQKRERFSDITLLRKPEPINFNLDKEQEPSVDAEAEVTNYIEDNNLESLSVSSGTTNDIALLEKPDMTNLNLNTGQGQEGSGDHTVSSHGNDVKVNSLKSTNLSSEELNATEINLNQSLEVGDASILRDHGKENDSVTGFQLLDKSFTWSAEETSGASGASETNLADSNTRISIEAPLQGKPERLDQSVKGTSNFGGEEMVLVNPESYGNGIELENLPTTSPIKKREDTYWTRAEDLVKTGGREEVELISSSTRGFVVSFGSLIGFLPYRNLAAKWKYLAFESWLRRKGLDPSMYKQNLGIIGSYESTSKTSFDSSLDPQIDGKVEGEISSDMKLEDLLMIYDQEKLKFLSSFVGQKIKVNVILAERKSRRLIFSVKPKEKEELIERKRSLMAKLSIGDVVKCFIKKITYFGIFVEVEGVPALIHQTEVSWDATLDPASYFKIGQIVEAKVHQLDFSLERIFLSLKEISPDPLIEALEAVVGDHGSLDGRLEAAQEDIEWADVESLIKELQQFEGIQCVSKGRLLLSPGLAPTFQVYMVSMFENQYKLLARSGNRAQEVIVQTSLGKEAMKSAILTCTNRIA